MIKLVIFDLNGTLTNDLFYHVESYYRTINNAGLRVSRKDIEELLGKPCEEITRILAEKQGKKLDTKKVCFEKRVLFNELVSGKEKEILIEGADFVLKELKKRGIKLGLFTGSGRENILLEKRLLKLFDVVIAGMEAKNVKPAPDGLQKMMKKLKVRMNECIYVGDLPIDMETAKNAGIKGIALRNKRIAEKELLKAGAEKVIKNLKEILEMI